MNALHDLTVLDDALDLLDHERADAHFENQSVLATMQLMESNALSFRIRESLR